MAGPWRPSHAPGSSQSALPPPPPTVSERITSEPSGVDDSAGRLAGTRRLVGVDATRGLALVGMMAVHMLPSWNEQTGEATVTWWLFSGNSAALFALLAGVGLALSTGGTRAHEGRAMTADRVGLLVRAGLIAALGLVVGGLMPAEDPPTHSILLYYGVFFVLAIPFLRATPRWAFGFAAVFVVVSPVLIQGLSERLPEWEAYNPSFIDVFEAPMGTVAQLLVTGTYPALAYLVYLLVGLGIGRLNLSRLTVQRRLVVIGLGMTALAHLASLILLYAAGGYRHMLYASGWRRSKLDDALTWGPDGSTPDSWWWLAVTTPHANTPLSILSSLGLGLAALGVFLLLARSVARWLVPLSAMGAMTLTLYTAHLVLLSFEVHYDHPYVWFIISLLAGCAFAIAWQRVRGRGPLEQGVHSIVLATRRRVRRREDAHARR